ncbi:hypothetical protein [Bacillus fonticola]|uniref:hypothetical protein n=1 Tax=Bacillus fonticola TaxID=2728853 RepID=UPI0014761A3E|nr:hypothetical protein [Bacillus fonticola]
MWIEVNLLERKSRRKNYGMQAMILCTTAFVLFVSWVLWERTQLQQALNVVTTETAEVVETRQRIEREARVGTDTAEQQLEGAVSSLEGVSFSVVSLIEHATSLLPAEARVVQAQWNGVESATLNVEFTNKNNVAFFLSRLLESLWTYEVTVTEIKSESAASNVATITIIWVDPLELQQLQEEERS